LVSRQSSTLIFGGRCDGAISSLIAKYTNNNWEQFGYLQTSRHGHRAIVNEYQIYIVGGASGPDGTGGNGAN